MSSKGRKYICSEILLCFTYILYILEHIQHTHTHTHKPVFLCISFHVNSLKNKQISVKKMITLILKGTFSFVYTVGVNVNDENPSNNIFL